MTTTPSTAPNPQRLVLRNTLVTFGAQAISTPISIGLTAVMARFLGASDYGQMYVAWMLCSFGFLVVDWGQGAVLTGSIARDRAVAGRLLGSALAWRSVAVVLVYGALAATSALLRYSVEFQLVLALTVLQCTLQSAANAYLDTVKGFERMDVGASGQIAQQLLAVLVVLPTVLLGGRLRGVMLAQAGTSALVLLYVWQAGRKVGIGRLRVDREALNLLASQGSAFLMFSFAMLLQPNVDAVLLSKLAPPDVVGWHAVARRLVGALVLPASLVMGALYPTLSRLHVEDRDAFLRTARSAIRSTFMLAVPMSLCCALYADIGILIFSHKAYGAAKANLVVLSAFLLLTYLSMPLGSSVLAAGRQRAWAAAQFLCVVVSAALDPWLIPLFQARMGNGGLGVCVAAVVSETLMVAVGAWLAPRTLFDRGLNLTIVRSFAAGLGMTAVAFALSRLTPFVAAPIALCAYVGGLWALGGLSREQMNILRDALGRRVARR